MKEFFQNLRTFFRQFSIRTQIIVGSTICALLALLLSGIFSGGSDAVNLIPKNARFVAVINFESLASKADLKNLEGDRYSILSEDPLVAQIISKPESTGIDFSNDIFLFSYSDSTKHREPDGKKYWIDAYYTALALDIDDKEDFQTFSKNAVNEWSDTMNVVTEVFSKGFSYYLSEPRKNTIGDSYLICWDNEKAMVLKADYVSPFVIKESQDLIEKGKYLMSLNENEVCINTVSSFQEFYSNKTELSLWLNANASELNALSAVNGLNLLNDNLSLFITFQNDGVHLKLHSDLNEDSSKDLSKLYGDGFNRSLLNYVPKNNLVVAGLSMNVMKMFDKFYFDLGLNRAERTLANRILNDFKGSAIMAVLDRPQEKKDEPLPMALVVDLENEAPLDEIVEHIENDARYSIKESDSYWEVTDKIDGNTIAYVCVLKKIGMLTNDYECLKRFMDGGYGNESIRTADIGSKISNSNIFLNVELNKIAEKEKERKMDLGLDSRLPFESLEGFLDQFELSMTSKDLGSVEIVLKSKENGNNSLNRLIEFFGNLYENDPTNKSDDVLNIMSSEEFEII